MSDEKKPSVRWMVGLQGDRRTIFNAVRRNEQYGEKWRDEVLDNFDRIDSDDEDSEVGGTFPVDTLDELVAVFSLFHGDKLVTMALFCSLSTEAVHAEGWIDEHYHRPSHCGGETYIKDKARDSQIDVAIQDAINILTKATR